MAWFRRTDSVPRSDRTTAEAVAGVRFSTTSFREGYDVEDVDAFLEACVETLRWLEGGVRPAAPLTMKQVRDARFGQTKFRSGYDQGEVDDLLDQVAATLYDAEAARDSTS